MLYARKFRPHEGLEPQSAVSMVAKIILEKLQAGEVFFNGFPEILLTKAGVDYHLMLSRGPRTAGPVILKEHEAVKLAIRFLSEQPLEDDLTEKIINCINQLDYKIFIDKLTKKGVYNEITV